MASNVDVADGLLLVRLWIGQQPIADLSLVWLRWNAFYDIKQPTQFSVIYVDLLIQLESDYLPV